MNDGLIAADAHIRSHPNLDHTLNLLVAHHGEMVFERYYRDSRLTCTRSIPSPRASHRPLSASSPATARLAGDAVASLVAAPGWGVLYNDGAAHVLSAVIEAVAGKPPRRSRTATAPLEEGGPTEWCGYGGAMRSATACAKSCRSELEPIQEAEPINDAEKDGQLDRQGPGGQVTTSAGSPRAAPTHLGSGWPWTLQTPTSTSSPVTTWS